MRAGSTEQRDGQVIWSAKGIFDVMILGTASEIFIIQNWGLVEIF